MSNTGADFRIMTPLALMAALQQAGTIVCEPILRFNLEIPADTLSVIMPALAQVRATAETTEVQGSICTRRGTIPAARVHELQMQLPTLSSGEGVLEAQPDDYRPVSGPPPERPRTDFNPLDRREYLTLVQRRA